MSEPSVADTGSHREGPMRLYEAVPDGEPRGAVVVIQEAFGVNAHIEDVTRRSRPPATTRSRPTCSTAPVAGRSPTTISAP